MTSQPYASLKVNELVYFSPEQGNHFFLKGIGLYVSNYYVKLFISQKNVIKRKILRRKYLSSLIFFESKEFWNTK